MLIATNPATGQVVREVEEDGPETVDRKLGRAHAVAAPWGEATFAERAEVLARVVERLRAEKEALAELMVEEVGKPIRQARGEIDKTVWAFEHYAAHAERYLAPDVIDSDATHSRVQYLPLGPVLGILPWNSPFWLAGRVAAPALMAGNPVLVKHDPHVPGCAQALARIFTEAQAPAGLLDVLLLSTPRVEGVLREPRVVAVSLTGSTGAGRAVAAIAGERLLPMVLELGGSDPSLVLPDADLDAAAGALCLSRSIMTGQSCIAPKRLLVHADVHDAFVERLAAALRGLQVGDPADEATDVGPLARVGLRDGFHAQVQDALDKGARALLGGAIPEGPGAFYPPTLLVDVTPDMRVLTEETFGPVWTVRRVDSLEQALAEANDTPYGLAGSIWTGDIPLAERIARRLQVGQVAINGLVKTDPRLPSGGIKASGLGRELGPHGIHEFVNAQQIWIGPKKGDGPLP
jgi:succinate-semialdehyde dehydrogenase / glutarate-semialdehyde dehydrogenase